MIRSPKLDEFYNAKSTGNRVIGTYLYPHLLFDRFDPNDPYSATAILARIQLDSEQVFVTCNGGLFIESPTALVDNVTRDAGENFKDKQAFEEKTADVFNQIICELTFNGIVSEPATPVHIAGAKLIDDHILITSATGGREIYLERTLMPALQLSNGRWLMCRIRNCEVINQISANDRIPQLLEISGTLPGLIAGAYFMFSRRQLAEALVDGWVVVEQILDRLWTRYTSDISDNSRKQRLSDTRTYSAAVRIEILHTLGIIPTALYAMLNVSRKHRNDLAHRSKISLTMATEVLECMKQMIESFCKTSIAQPLTHVGVNW